MYNLLFSRCPIKMLHLLTNGNEKGAERGIGRFNLEDPSMIKR